MESVFISYRRGDSVGHTGRLRDRLVAALGTDQVFRDLDSIPLGVDFRDELAAALDASDVLLAVIGPRWLSAMDQEGRVRLDDPDDLVRVEIATALRRPDVRVVPVLVDGGQLPHASELPPDLRPLVARQAVSLRDDRWDDDVDSLLARLSGGRRPWWRPHTAPVAAVTIVAVATLGIWMWWPEPDVDAAFAAQINFQPANAEVPDGYLVDSGEPFGARTGQNQGEGYEYGWVRPGTDEPVSMIGHTRDRGYAPDVVDQRYDTLIHTRRRNANTGEIDEASWELAVPDGNYRVTAAVGDQEGERQPTTHTLLAEGRPLITGFQSSPSARFRINTIDVEVDDGRLTLDAGDDAGPKIAYVEVTEVT